MSYNMRRGLNAIRCALLSGFTNFWLLIASGYYACLEFNCANDYIDLIQQSVPYVCTCTDEVNEMAQEFNVSPEHASEMSNCV